MDAFILIATFAMCFWRTGIVETEYLIRITMGLISFMLNWFLAAWTVNGSVYDVMGMLLENTQSLFFLIVALLMLLFVLYQGITFIHDKTVTAIESQQKANQQGDMREFRDTREFQDTSDYQE
jgi:hypothetical protein